MQFNRLASRLACLRSHLTVSGLTSRIAPSWHESCRASRRPCSRDLMAVALDDETWRPEEDQIIKLVVVTEGPK